MVTEFKLVFFTDIHQRSRTCAILIPAWGWIGGLGVSPVIKITWFIRCVCYLHTCTSTAIWVWRQTSAKCCTARKDRECVYVVGKNLNTPKLSPIGDDAIPWGVGSLESLVYICGIFTTLTYVFFLKVLIMIA